MDLDTQAKSKKQTTIWTETMTEKREYKISGSLNRAIDEVDRLLAAGGAPLVIDFSHCTFVSVEGLEWLEEMLMRASSHSDQVRFINLPPTIYKVFKVAHIDNILAACGSPRPTSPGSAVC
jgi:anti-anti-sigma regulatory factor